MATKANFQLVDSLRSPKLTAVVASMLRRKILTGELKEGDNLPPEPDLMTQLGVSRPTLREALRVLESEMLIRPRRGSREGAEVIGPSVELAARYMGFVLQYRGVTLEDVMKARLMMEPPLAGLVAARKSPRVLAELRAALLEEERVVGESAAFARASVRFHEVVCELAGVETMALCVHQFNWVIGRLTEERDAHATEDPVGRATKAHRAHARFCQLVEAGEAEEAERFWAAHVKEIDRRLLQGRSDTKVVDLFR